MSQVLQLPADHDMSLYTDPKEQSNPVARVTLLSLTSQPVDHDDRRQAPNTDMADRSPGELSEEEDREYQDYSTKHNQYPDYSSKDYAGYSSKRGDYQEYSSNEDTSDVEPLPGDDDRPIRSRKLHGETNPTFASRQRNLKQKFVSLLRRFKVNEEVLESVHELGDRTAESRFVEDLLEDVENLSDSEPDIDTISVHSTPKPKLRPFFTARHSSGPSNNTYSENLNLPQQYLENERLSDDSATPRRTDSDSNPEEEPANQQQARNAQQAVAQQKAQQDSAREPSGKRAGPRSKYHRKSSLPSLPSRRRRFIIGEEKRRSFRERKMSENSEAASDGRRGSVPENVVAATSQSRRLLLDQMAAILSSETALPECIVLVNSHEWQSQALAQSLQNAKQRTVCTNSASEVRAVLSAVVNKIHKYCSKNTPGTQAQSLPIKLAVVGGDSYISSVLRPYIELFSSKSPEWLGYIRFLIVPFSCSVVSKNLSAIDSRYHSLFNDSLWKDIVHEKSDNSPRFDMSEITGRIVRYLTGASCLVQLPLAEAIVTNKNKGVDDTSQMIVPFIGEVRLGPIDLGNSIPTSTDLDDSTLGLQVSLSGSPPQPSVMAEKVGYVNNAGDKAKDPSTSAFTGSASSNASCHPPALTSLDLSGLQQPPTSSSQPSESIDLQVDYWMAPLPRADQSVEKNSGTSSSSASKKELKCSLKTMIRSMQVYRPLQLSPTSSVGGGGMAPHEGGGAAASGLSMVVVTQEKKQKIMRIGKKSKDTTESKKSQQIDSISRLICTSKSQSQPLNVTIDGADFSGVKFFQVSAQWQTHVKHFPVLVFSVSDPSPMTS